MSKVVKAKGANVKLSFSVTAILVCLLATGCDQPPNSRNNDLNDKESHSPTPQVKSYRFKSAVGNCDTYQRTFETQLEMCYAIQVPELNSDDCAEAERFVFFQQHCDGIVYEPEQARQKVIHTDGNSVDCELSERDLPSIRHFTGTNRLVMEHTSTRAVVTHSGSNGRMVLRLALHDINTNKQITRVQKVWQDETEPLSVSAPAAMGSPVLTCLLSLAQDPDRD